MEGKYLAIKNWEKHQTAKGKMRWIKLSVHMEEDDEILDLTIFQQGLLVMLWRLRGRAGRNLPNDPLKLCRKLSIEGQERHNAVRAIQQLKHSGWLIPTDEELSFLNSPLEIEEEIDKKEEEKKQSAPAEPAVMPKPTTPSKVTFLGVEPKATTFELPPWIHEETWFAYEQMRQKLRKPMTNHARGLIVTKLRELMNKGHPPKDVLEQSILNGWQGVFELKQSRGSYGGNSEPSKASRREERNREVIRDLARDLYGDHDLGNSDQQPQADGVARQNHDAADVAQPVEIIPPVRH